MPDFFKNSGNRFYQPSHLFPDSSVFEEYLSRFPAAFRINPGAFWNFFFFGWPRPWVGPGWVRHQLNSRLPGYQPPQEFPHYSNSCWRKSWPVQTFGYAPLGFVSQFGEFIWRGGPLIQLALGGDDRDGTRLLAEPDEFPMLAEEGNDLPRLTWSVGGAGAPARLTAEFIPSQTDDQLGARYQQCVWLRVSLNEPEAIDGGGNRRLAVALRPFDDRGPFFLESVAWQEARSVLQAGGFPLIYCDPPPVAVRAGSFSGGDMLGYWLRGDPAVDQSESGARCNRGLAHAILEFEIQPGEPLHLRLAAGRGEAASIPEREIRFPANTVEERRKQVEQDWRESRSVFQLDGDTTGAPPGEEPPARPSAYWWWRTGQGWVRDLPAAWRPETLVTRVRGEHGPFSGGKAGGGVSLSGAADSSAFTWGEVYLIGLALLQWGHGDLLIGTLREWPLKKVSVRPGQGRGWGDPARRPGWLLRLFLDYLEFCPDHPVDNDAIGGISHLALRLVRHWHKRLSAWQREHKAARRQGGPDREPEWPDILSLEIDLAALRFLERVSRERFPGNLTADFEKLLATTLALADELGREFERFWRATGQPPAPRGQNFPWGELENWSFLAGEVVLLPWHSMRAAGRDPQAERAGYLEKTETFQSARGLDLRYFFQKARGEVLNWEETAPGDNTEESESREEPRPEESSPGGATRSEGAEGGGENATLQRQWKTVGNWLLRKGNGRGPLASRLHPRTGGGMTEESWAVTAAGASLVREALIREDGPGWILFAGWLEEDFRAPAWYAWRDLPTRGGRLDLEVKLGIQKRILIDPRKLTSPPESWIFCFPRSWALYKKENGRFEKLGRGSRIVLPLSRTPEEIFLR